jgi:hypothetical protein
MTTTPLSPAAQAIRSAYETGGLDAVLIAALEQLHCEPGPTYDASGIISARLQLLALATELRQEGQS